MSDFRAASFAATGAARLVILLLPIDRFPPTFRPSRLGTLPATKAVPLHVPEDIVPMEISTDDVPIGETVELCGFGTGEFRHWNAKYCGEGMGHGGHVIFSWAIQGDSGGPIIYNGKVVGVICFGTGVKKYKDTNRVIVGPVYGSNVERVERNINPQSGES